MTKIPMLLCTLSLALLLRVAWFTIDCLLSLRPTDEFFVSVQTVRNEWEDRILVVTTKSIDEMDVGTGGSVTKHDTKQLTNVQDVSKGTPNLVSSFISFLISLFLYFFPLFLYNFLFLFFCRFRTTIENN